MAKQAVLVRYSVKQGRMAEFLAILKDHIARTRASEPGCVQFDLLVPHDGNDCIHLYEVYADDEAVRIHNASEQLARYKAATNALLDERAIAWCTIEE
jgi:(4S)-4-hydroxy-5-phosphonooxypentane-2,3-dione isomerase